MVAHRSNLNLVFLFEYQLIITSVLPHFVQNCTLICTLLNISIGSNPLIVTEMRFLKAVCFLNSFWGMIINYFILMLRKARSWSTLFMANLLGFILGLSLVELILMQFFNLYQTDQSTWQPTLVLALIVLSLVTINYANFTTMQLKNRFRESGVRKLLGATNKQVATQHLLESIMIVIVAVFLSMILTEVVHPWFNQLFNMSFSLREHSMSIQLLMAIFLIGFVGIIGSVYPVWNFARITVKDIINHLKNVK